MDTANTQVYDSLFARAIAEIKREEDEGKHAGSGLFMKSDYGE